MRVLVAVAGADGQPVLPLPVGGWARWPAAQRSVRHAGPRFDPAALPAVQAAAARAGADAETARALALGAVEGAARSLRERDTTATELRAQVTSPNGTTAAGLAALQEGGFEALVTRAFDAARSRAVELGAASSPR